MAGVEGVARSLCRYSQDTEDGAAQRGDIRSWS